MPHCYFCFLAIGGATKYAVNSLQNLYTNSKVCFGAGILNRVSAVEHLFFQNISKNVQKRKWRFFSFQRQRQFDCDLNNIWKRLENLTANLLQQNDARIEMG